MTNLADHLKASNEIRGHIEEADALAKKLAQELSMARATLEALKIYAPDDRFTITAPYHLRSGRESPNEASMSAMIRLQVARINDVIGDRANA